MEGILRSKLKAHNWWEIKREGWNVCGKKYSSLSSIPHTSVFPWACPALASIFLTCIGAPVIPKAFFFPYIGYRTEKEYLPSSPGSVAVSRSNRGRISIFWQCSCQFRSLWRGICCFTLLLCWACFMSSLRCYLSFQIPLFFWFGVEEGDTLIGFVSIGNLTSPENSEFWALYSLDEEEIQPLVSVLSPGLHNPSREGLGLDDL